MDRRTSDKTTGPDRINVGQDDQMEIWGFRSSFLRTVLTWLLVLCSGGTLLILLSWKPSIRLRLSHRSCSLQEATTVLLKDCYNQEFVEQVVSPPVTVTLANQKTYFHNKKLKYIWQKDFSQFIKVNGLEVESCAAFHNLTNGLSSEEVDKRSKLYGENSIMVEVKPVHKLVLREITSPFYIYQMFIVVVWLVQLYYQFSVCILFLSIVSITATVWETRKQSKALRDTVRSHSYVTVIRDGLEVEKASRDLVPGDTIILPERKFIMECDAVLVSGSCVVNESMLTGESVPITKVSIDYDPHAQFSSIGHKKNTLFCGTQVLQARPSDGQKVQAVVYRTGFTTVKGELVRTILFPKPVNFKLYRDLFISMFTFLILGIPAMVYTAVVWHRLGALVKDTVIIVVDVATFVVPPLLPAVMTSVNAHAQRRLRKHEIFCLNSRYINFCGGLDIVCFDKTGTLTEDSLDLSGVVPVQDASFSGAIKDVMSIGYCPLLTAMATCHSLTQMDGQLMGYTLDIKMFEAIQWELEEPAPGDLTSFEKVPSRIVRPLNRQSEQSTLELAIVRQFPFESLLQRMTVVIKAAGTDYFEVYVKGAPENVSALSRPETVPEDFKDVLETYTRQAFRVLGVGWKCLPLHVTWEDVLVMDRGELEEDLDFQGLLVLYNQLKPETIPALKALKDANIQSIMVTGDNLLTAISVSRECGMVEEMDAVISVEARRGGKSPSQITVEYSYSKLPGYSERLNVGQNGLMDDVHVPLLRNGRYHLAMDGKTFALIRTHEASLLKKVVHKGTVFARMLPEQKLQLIETLQQLGHQVGMCGDGANDCGALKTAHAGVSLSPTEASVASPFTSKNQNIQCIPTVIREGRATLSATFGAFRYMVTYCFILLAAALFMFWDGQKPSDGAYVIIDIVLSLLPPILFGSTEAFPQLARRPPIRSILSFLPQFSIITFTLIQIAVYVFTWRFCITQPWYEPFVYRPEKTHFSAPSHLGTSLLSVNMMSYIIAAVIFSPGPPYRKDFFSNKLYLGVILMEFILVTYLCLYPADVIQHYINFKMAPHIEYHLILFGVSLANFIVCYLWEVLFIQFVLFEHVLPKIRRMRGPIHKFEKMELSLSSRPDWPPVGKRNYTTVDLDSSEDLPPPSPRISSQPKEEVLDQGDREVPDIEVVQEGQDEIDIGLTRRSSEYTRWIKRQARLNHLLSGATRFSSDMESPYAEPVYRQPMTTFATFRGGSNRVSGGRLNELADAFL